MLIWNSGTLGEPPKHYILRALKGRDLRHKYIHVIHYIEMSREMTETVAAATGQDNPGSVSEHDVNALAAHQVISL